MPGKRDSAWLRETLCDEIESIRAGKSDHNRAKSVATLATAILKSVEVEMVFRQQQSTLDGTEHAQLGALPLCEQAALPAPDLATAPNLVEELTTTNDEQHDEAVDRLVEAAFVEAKPQIKSPIVPQGPRFVQGRYAK